MMAFWKIGWVAAAVVRKWNTLFGRIILTTPWGDEETSWETKNVRTYTPLSATTTLKYQISVPQVIRVPQQKSTLKTGQISWNNRSEDREIANYHSPIHCNSFTCQFKGFKVIFGGKSLRTTGNFGLELIRVPVRLFDTLEYRKSLWKGLTKWRATKIAFVIMWFEIYADFT